MKLGESLPLFIDFRDLSPVNAEDQWYRTLVHLLRATNMRGEACGHVSVHIEYAALITSKTGADFVCPSHGTS